MNRFHILTLFPEMVMDGLNTSIIGRAIEAGLLEINRGQYYVTILPSKTVWKVGMDYPVWEVEPDL